MIDVKTGISSLVLSIISIVCLRVDIADAAGP